MKTEFGVYKYEISPSPEIWVKETTPTLVLGIAADALLYTEVDAMTVATYLSNTTGQSFRVGRPDDRHPA